ncbi:hypothetical protein F4819DRAFT_10347 [Hypoxylon fuscum]|nr:hypothetical protein F4819DRAFT_10347 [Hypoxylon fuscum]
MEPRPDHRFNPFGPDANNFDDPDFDPSVVDYSDPAFMSKLIGTTVKPQSPASVLREAKERSSKIFSSYDTLREIMERHEATIWKRWAKKTKQQKLKILLTAWPGMAAVHRPDFNAFRKKNGQLSELQTRYREHFMWPHINQEDLSRPKTLPLLLNARARHPPPEFSGADNAAMHLGYVTRAIVPIFLNQHTMIINGATNAQEYGKLIAWDDHSDAFEWMATRKQYLPGEGLDVLEAQERLMDFLVDCCKQILHDIPLDTLTTDVFPIQPEPELRLGGEAGGFNSLAIMAAEAPYRVPAHLDLGRIESLLAARASAAEDHVWALREDPSYFVEQLFETKEHRSEMLKDMNGNIHPTLKPGRESLFWARVIGDVVFTGYIQLEIFSELHQQAKNLKQLQEQYQSSIASSKDLPQEYLMAILRFRHYIEQAAKGPLAQLKKDVPASPPLRRSFVRQPPLSSTSSQIVVQSKSMAKTDAVESQLTWLLRTLWEDDYNLFLAGMPLIVDELERLLQAEKSASDLVSGRIAAMIGDLSIISQCNHQLNLYLPWARGFELEAGNHGDALKKDYAERTRSWAKMMAALEDKNLSGVAKLGDPSGKKFFYPAEKRRTRETVQALCQAESNLDDVWAAIDQLVYTKCGHLNDTAVRRILSQARTLQRTPKWVDGTPDTTEGRVKNVETMSSIDNLYQPLSTLYFGLPANDQETTEKRKDKPKTRGLPRKQELDTNPTEETGTEVHPAPIPVDARSLKVFRTVFFNPEVTSSPGEIAWSDFLHAMTSTGLFSAEKLYGSVWQFQRSDGLGRIQFHEPHPRGKIPFAIARRHGRRLNRAFGFVGRMFMLK